MAALSLATIRSPCGHAVAFGLDFHSQGAFGFRMNRRGNRRAWDNQIGAARASVNGSTSGAESHDDSSKRIKKVLILGGGTAGWMAAAYLGKALQGTAQVTVLEAPDVPKLGVGEATIPNLQTTFFDFLGIPEEEWMRECNASYKMAIKFVNWRTGGDGCAQARPLDQGQSRGADYFYHTFSVLPMHDHIPLSHYWVQRYQAGLTDVPLDYACLPDTLAMDLNKAPRAMDGTPATTYAWHLDAHLVADYLRRHATTKLGVHHIQDRMERAELRSGDGHIHAVHTASGRELTADLFVDCSGFRGLLINQALQEPFVDMSHHLLCNSAVASAIPHDDAAHGVEPYTSSIAMPAGWTWKIPMLGRFGSGYVYSSAFATDEQAATDFCRMWGLDPARQPLNKIRFRVGRNRRAWVRNCVAIGTSSAFLEPLESTGIYFIYAALWQLLQHFPDKDFHPGLADAFNREIEFMVDDSRDFLQAHFAFSPRRDTEFWRAASALPLGPGMAAKMEAYKAGLPVNLTSRETYPYFEFNSNFRQVFRDFWTNSSYYCILAGLGHLPDAPLPRLRHMPASAASVDATFHRIQQRQQELAHALPSCYHYLRKLHGKELLRR